MLIEWQWEYEMNLGEKLRQLRSDRNFTQPTLAEAIGIEQSYLSKLETGKSVPSGEVFTQILDFFDLSVGELVDDLDQRSRLKLRQIPSVANYLSNQRDLIIGSRRRWLLIACISVATGIGLFYAGYVHLFVPETVYQYASEEGRFLTRDYLGDLHIVTADGGMLSWYLQSAENVNSWVNKVVATLGLILASLGLMLLAVERKLTRFQ